METPLVLDTDILIELMRGNPEIVDYVKTAEKRRPILTTTVNLFELFLGAFNSNRPEYELLRIAAVQELTELLTLTPESAKRAGAIAAFLKKQGTPVDVKELFIGAIAASNGFELKTNNVKDFSRIPGLMLAK